MMLFLVMFLNKNAAVSFESAALWTLICGEMKGAEKREIVHSRLLCSTFVICISGLLRTNVPLLWGVGGSSTQQQWQPALISTSACFAVRHFAEEQICGWSERSARGQGPTVKTVFAYSKWLPKLIHLRLNKNGYTSISFTVTEIKSGVEANSQGWS